MLGRFGICLLAALSAVISQPVRADTVIGFEDLPDAYFFSAGDQNIGGYYPGVTLGPDVTALSVSRFGGYDDSGFPPHSGDVAVWDAGDATVEIDFAAPVQSFGVWYTTFDPLTLQAFDGADDLLGTAVGDPNTDGSTGVSSFLSFASPGIQSVTLTSTPGFFVLDDLTYDTSGTATPEPGSLLFMATGMILIICAARRRGGSASGRQDPEPKACPTSTPLRMGARLTARRWRYSSLALIPLAIASTARAADLYITLTNPPDLVSHATPCNCFEQGYGGHFSNPYEVWQFRVPTTITPTGISGLHADAFIQNALDNSCNISTTPDMSACVATVNGSNSGWTQGAVQLFAGTTYYLSTNVGCSNTQCFEPTILYVSFQGVPAPPVSTLAATVYGANLPQVGSFNPPSGGISYTFSLPVAQSAPLGTYYVGLWSGGSLGCNTAGWPQIWVSPTSSPSNIAFINGEYPLNQWIALEFDFATLTAGQNLEFSVTCGDRSRALNIGTAPNGQPAYVITNSLAEVFSAPLPPPCTPSLLALSGGTGCGASLGSPGPTNPSGFTREPINTATGNYLLSATDLAVPGKGVPFAFTRSYNSADGYSGPLGSGWTHSYNVFLTVNPTSGLVTVKEADGHEDSFVLASGGAYNPATPGLFDALAQNPDGTFTLTRKAQTKLSFSAAGSLTGIVDRIGNAVALAYDASGRLTSVTDAAGRKFSFANDATGRIVGLSDPLGRSWTYGYDSNGNLVSVRDAAGGLTQYAYDGSHRMTGAIDPRNVTFLQNTFDGLGRVISQSNGRGFATTLAYNTPSSGATTITDPLGNATQHLYDASLRLTGVIDAKGGTVTYAYDANNDRTSVTDQNGGITSFSYDANGNVTGIRDALGNATALTYDGANDLLSATNPKGNATTYSYDANGNLTQIRDAAGGVTRLAYDGSGLLLSKTDARGNVTAYAHDGSGNLTKRTDPLGGASAFGYDGVGRLVSATDPKGHTASSTYDLLSRPLTRSDALGHTTQFSYDPIGNLVKVVDANGNATAYVYDATNNLTGVTDALGHTTVYGYDGNNNRVTVTNARGKVTTYAFDALNRVAKATDPLSNATLYSYDSVGNVVGTTDANGNANVYLYDALNRMVKGTYGDGKAVTYGFDQDGKRTSMTDWRGSTAYSYDVLDRLLSVAGPAGTTQYGYDAAGNRTTLTYPDGKAVNHKYDALNRLSQLTDWAGKVTSYAYDAAGNPTGTAFPNGAASSYAYDNANRLLQITNQAAGRIVSSFSYSLDNAGNRIQVTSSAAGVTKYGYDLLNRLTSWTVPSGQVTQYSYDAVGNRVTMVSSAGTTAYTYDDADQMLTAGTSTFQYDSNGNQVAKTTGSTTVRNSFDALNRLSAATGGGINSGYQYDGDGNRVGQTVPSGTYQYQNDTASALPVVLSETGPDGSIDYLYGRSLVSETSGAFQYYYQSDGLGSAASLTDATGSLKATYSFDPWGKLLTPIDPLGTKNKYKFTGEALDPGTGFAYLRARYYDPSVARFLTQDAFRGFLPRPQTQNRYSYGLNTPTLLVDRSGNSAEDANQAQFTQPPSLSPEQQYQQQMLAQGVPKYETFLEKGLITSASAIPWAGLAAPLIADQPNEQRSITALADWMIDGLLRTAAGRTFLEHVGEGNVAAVQVSETINSVEDMMRSIGIPPEAVSLIGSGLTY
jgi:RHS repeat-associated protein